MGQGELSTRGRRGVCTRVDRRWETKVVEIVNITPYTNEYVIPNTQEQSSIVSHPSSIYSPSFPSRGVYKMPTITYLTTHNIHTYIHILVLIGIPSYPIP